MQPGCLRLPDVRAVMLDSVPTCRYGWTAVDARPWRHAGMYCNPLPGAMLPAFNVLLVMENGMRKTSRFLCARLLFPMLIVLPGACLAHECDIAADAINQAAELLKEVGRQTSLDDGRRLARNLQRAVGDAAVEASDCDCERSAAKLDAAAARVRRARSAESRREFSDQINHAIDDFNVGVAHMEICIVN
jgi:hypothetical protein